MVKGEDKYLRTIAEILRFLRYHNLRRKPLILESLKLKKNRSEDDLAQTDDDADPDTEGDNGPSL